MIRLSTKGDTIIEVMLSMTLLSAILFTSWAIVNRSTQLSLAARQRVVMVNQIKEQAEIIKSMYNNDATQVISKKFGGSTVFNSVSSAPAADACDNLGVNGAVANSFHFDANVAAQDGVKRLKVNDNSAVTWVQLQEVSEPASAGYMDFYIRSCWTSTGGVQKQENSTVILRLNK